MVMRNNADRAVSGCSAARMPVFRPATSEYINIYILFITSVVKPFIIYPVDIYFFAR